MRSPFNLAFGIEIKNSKLLKSFCAVQPPHLSIRSQIPPNQLELYNDPILNDSIRKSNGTISLRDLNIDWMLRPSPFLPTRKRRKKSRWELKIIRGVQPKLDLSLPEYIGNYIYFAPSLRPIRDYCGSANAVFIPFFYICQRRRRKK